MMSNEYGIPPPEPVKDIYMDAIRHNKDFAERIGEFEHEKYEGVGPNQFMMFADYEIPKQKTQFFTRFDQKMLKEHPKIPKEFSHLERCRAVRDMLNYCKVYSDNTFSAPLYNHNVGTTFRSYECYRAKDTKTALRVVYIEKKATE